jgi:hypothetical protein
MAKKRKARTVKKTKSSKKAKSPRRAAPARRRTLTAASRKKPSAKKAGKTARTDAKKPAVKKFGSAQPALPVPMTSSLPAAVPISPRQSTFPSAG